MAFMQGRKRSDGHQGMKDLETQLYYIGLFLLMLGGLLGALYYFVFRSLLPQIPCFFSSVLGIYCPGCGGTRAFIALLHGHFLMSFWYHPLVLYMVLIGGGFMLTQTLHRIGIKWIRGWKFHLWYLYGAIGVVGCNFLIKNALRLIWGITIE